MALDAGGERTSRVFVYGTLMPGEIRWPALRPFAVGWLPVVVRGRLWDTRMGYPAARFDEADDQEIPGFLVALDERRLSGAIATLDRIEGEGVLYRRVPVSTSGGEAFSYEWLGPVVGLVPLPQGWPRTSTVTP